MTGHRYDAFILSAAVDEPLAATLQTTIESLTRKSFGRRGLSVFRDRTNLKPSASIADQLATALAQSEWLIVLVSAASTRSPSVAEQIGTWMSSRPDAADHVLLVRCDETVDLSWGADGRPVAPDTFPAPLAALAEPMFVECAQRSEELDRQAAIRLVAAIRGLDPEDVPAGVR
ncbi:unnamed protein product [Phaeothamnion confervicola]